MLSRRILENHILFLKTLGKPYTFSLLIPWKTMLFSQNVLEKFAKNLCGHICTYTYTHTLNEEILRVSEPS